ncbi:FadR/GntR family transcriptional regulator [Mycolicibacterium smegmatis]|uniref:FadR/GntR family transcriptional regulator n=1 Tax=Mycolicibacterium smegmatis TaxID=1772 RepID=UPI001CC123C4|nr:FCD domain-containing protein [Mycolicibacterium smegmatis]MCC3334535.1 FCD domain-containing protein [Mycolicibacterium smegmatis]MCO4194234.1 FCD domain-containing protein [Mycolicibacterium smegmatis]MDF1899007.1 FCD domain-containing protein [Mycolicibacterium smegmatis]MDF1904831.1 FCD domain-containing protein [Mycolicibacterium smegmatis]MDF1918700.1 FCD domain-containing protein [Mycolicibacterium smegmatis]
MSRNTAAEGASNVVNDVVFRPVRGGNIVEETVDRLVGAITLGVIPFGGQLPVERDLSQKLGVSRTTLRQAIRTLEERGVVEVRLGRGGGTFVRHRSTLPPAEEARARVVAMGDDLDDTLDYRQVLEPAAAELAARRRKPGAGEWLESLLSDTRPPTLAEYRINDARFHLAIAELAGVPSLTAAVADVEVRIAAPLALLPPWDDALERSDREHHALAYAIGRGNADEARQIMTEHLSCTAHLLRDLRLPSPS